MLPGISTPWLRIGKIGVCGVALSLAFAYGFPLPFFKKPKKDFAAEGMEMHSPGMES